MAPVRAEREIVYIQRISFADRRSLLPDRQMRRTRVRILHPVINRLRLYLAEHSLKLTYDTHITIYTHHIVLRIKRFLLVKRLRVLIHRDIVEMNISGLKDLFRVNILTLWHNLYLLSSFVRRKGFALPATSPFPQASYMGSRKVYHSNIASRITSQTVGCGKTKRRTSSTRISRSTIIAAP